MSAANNPTSPIATLPLKDVATGMGLVLFAVLVWSGWIVISRASVTGSLSPYDITALRFGVSGFLLMPVLIKKGFGLGPRGIWGGLLIMCLMGAPYNTLAINGMRFIPASQAGALINACMLSTTYLFAYFLLREPVGRLQIAGIGCCLAGIALIVLEKTGGQDQAWIGQAMCGIAGMMWGGYAGFNKAWRLDPLHAAAGICGYSLLVYLPFYFLLPAHLKTISTAPWSAILFQAGYQGILNSILALVAYNKGIALLGATRASAFIPLVPVLSTLLAIPLLHEIPSGPVWLGVGLVALGVLLACGVLRVMQARLARPRQIPA